MSKALHVGAGAGGVGVVGEVGVVTVGGVPLFVDAATGALTTGVGDVTVSLPHPNAVSAAANINDTRILFTVDPFVKVTLEIV
jgi:hypothetical protein